MIIQNYPIPLREKQVLVVEDDPLTQFIHQRFLEQLGYQVTVVESAREAITVADSDRYDALLLDLDLPDIRGEIVIIRVRLKECFTKRRLPL
jgi:DNA-binding response OmpR family regulator